MGFAGFFLAPALMGIISEVQGLRIAFLCMGVLGLVCIPFTLLLGRLQKI
jgi:MFS family permease